MRITRTSQSATYGAMAANASAIGERNDCSVKAVALATGCDYATAHAALAAKGRKNGHGAWTHQIIQAVREMGKTLEAVHPRDIIALYPAPHRDVLKSITTHHPRRFAKVWPKGTFLMFTRGHVLTVIDGVVHDWSINNTKRVTLIYRVL